MGGTTENRVTLFRRARPVHQVNAPRPPAPPRTLEDLAGEFLAHQLASGADLQTTESHLHIIRRHLGARLAIEISPRDIETMMAARLQEGITKATINRYSTTLSKFFTWCIERGYHPGPSPMDQVARFKEMPAPIRYLSHEEFDRLIVAAADHLKPVLVAAVHTGGSLRELLNLRWSDIDFDRGAVTFVREDSKRRKARQVPMSPTLCATLRNLRPDAPHRQVFEYNGRGLVSVRTAFENACQRAGLGPDVVFHTLRHTFASWFVVNGGDIFQLQEYLGHSSVKVTEQYACLSAVSVQAGAQFIGAPRRRGHRDRGPSTGGGT